MTEVSDDFKHPKCYANTRGGCSSTISGEHYVSHGLIKLYQDNDPAHRVQHRTGKGVGHPVTPKNFKANILCQKHNTALSPADDAALEFATFLRRNALQYDAGAGEWGDAEEISISGNDFQRWVLKLFLNHAATNHFGVQQAKTVQYPTEAVDLLLGRAAWPSTWGLCIPADLSNNDLWSDPFQRKEAVDVDWWGCAPFVFHDETLLGGAIVDLSHVSFGLTLFNPGRHDPRFNNPGNPIRGTVQRPRYMGWKSEGIEKRIYFDWEETRNGPGITYTLMSQERDWRSRGTLPSGRQFTKPQHP
ncbi:hypothetical protein EUA04_18710 [Mycolicibacterium obuense]|uniref:Uncharacterized protein n=1 Tax=Mycolicibacterium obuense TaxID=1807 RepID=A0A4R5X5U4_9MYCO|nr:hypothetical protein [Mycolicibacterium obuense]TDL06724.1 hypothetical protein EUA04_18710 [Mycolicibacterium obuense]